jgi:acetolactate decarboxylase
VLDERLLRAVRGHVRQVETLHDLELGHFDAVTTVGDAFGGCRVGLGVAEAADGEIVAIDGEVWRIPADGRPVEAPSSLGLPFAVAASGGRAITAELAPGMAFESITSALDRIHDLVTADPALVSALRIEGTFTDVLLRSEPRQEPPYQLLSDVLEHEVRFAFESWTGTLVGFRFSDEHDAKSIPGLHLHAIAADRSSGGHCHHATIESAVLTAWIDDVQFVIP